jgi:GT2 family glycosyltransferase
VGAHGLGRFIDGRGELIRAGQCEDLCRPRPTVIDGHVVSTPVDAPTTHTALIVGGCIVAPGAVLMRRSVVRDIAGFDPAFHICEDWDIYLRLTRHGPLRFLNRVVLSYRQHEANRSSDGARQRVEQRLVLSKALASSEDDGALSTRQLYRIAQRFYIGEKLRLAARCLGRKDPAGAARQITYSAGHVRRFVTGRP